MTSATPPSADLPNAPSPALPAVQAQDVVLAAQMDAAIQAFAQSSPALPLAIAFSGGADSSALLLACAARWPQQVQAWHVHHGLQAAADDFEHHCATLCARLGLPLRVRRVQARPAPGQSPEDAARRARYQAFDALAQEAGAAHTVALAQHADDQVETVLLALSRGAGLPGLAAMPAHWQRGPLNYCRPLLNLPGTATRAWLRVHGHHWIDDPSNADERYTRNRIRAHLLPALGQVFPAFRTTFARSAAHAAQAQMLLDEMAAQDLVACGIPPMLARLRSLSPTRQANLLRHWLTSVHHTTPSTAQMSALLRQIAACTTRGHRIHLKAGSGHVLRVGDALVWQTIPPTSRHTGPAGE